MNSTFGSPLIGLVILDVVIVVLLYGVTYVGYLATLQHPRNLQTIPVWKLSLIILSLMLNAAFVSVSTSGVDFPTLIASGIFLALLFLLLGAGSFAWNFGASMRWEFLARYSDRFVLGLLPVVIITGYWIGNIKLNTLFGIAMLIELLWLLRLHRENQFRKQHPLDEHSLAVLQTQAKGDLESFIKKHRIDELVTDGNEIHWMGCSKQSPPCPINYYINKLGLNTPPCCREHMKELCFDIDQLLTDMDIPHWLDGGTLLGAVRENGHFLAWEDDVDISFMLEDSINWDTFESEVRFKLNQLGYEVRTQKEYRMINVYYTPPSRWLYGLEQYRYRGEVKVDLIGNRVVNSYGQKVIERPLFKGAMPQTENGYYGVPVELMIPTSEIELFGQMVSCPRDSDAYLRTVYGNYTEVDYTYIDSEVATSRKSVDEVNDA
jgi:hypothetical protein